MDAGKKRTRQSTPGRWSVALSTLGLAALASTGSLGCATPESEGSSPSPSALPLEPAIAEAQQALKAPPVCVTLRRGADANAFDAMINQEAGATSSNYGTIVLLSAGSSGGTLRRSLFKWDLSSIPPGAVVLSAQVTLSMSSTGPATPRVHRVTAAGAWSEGTVTWASFGDAFDPAVLKSFDNGFPASTSVTFDLLATAAGWVNGSIPNNGLLIEQGAPSITRFNSSEWAVAARRPKLFLCYQVTCGPGFADCDNNGKNGCETALTTLDDCGACGAACEDDGNPCTAESCAAAACAHPPVVDGTTCDDGSACTQGDTCQAGACAGTSPVLCSGGDACHGAGVCDPATGACFDPELPDGSGCDDGDPCTLSDACHAGVCTGVESASCGPSFVDCNGDPDDGDETPLLVTPAHCGACGHACSAPHAVPTCSAGQCVLVCEPGFGDCDGLPGTGCEADLSVTACTNGAISGVVFIDLDGDGARAPGEPGLSGVGLRLSSDADCDGQGDLDLSLAPTDGAGAYAFPALPDSCYAVDVDPSTLSASYVLTTSNLPLPVSLAGGQSFLHADFGYSSGSHPPGPPPSTAIPAGVDMILQHTSAGLAVLAETQAPMLPGVTLDLVYQPALSDPITHRGECIERISACIDTNPGPLAGCIDLITPCPSNAGGSACCPPACLTQFKALMASGQSEEDAIENSFVEGSCVDGYAGQKAAAESVLY